MPSSELTQEQIEAVFAAMAQALDRAGPDRRERYLARLALLLAEALGDGKKALACVEKAGQDPY
jgi:hypothetical protein